MHLNMKKFLIWILIIGWAGLLFAQELPDKARYIPTKFRGEICAGSVDLSSSKETVSAPWIVFADRVNVSTWREAGGTGGILMESLGFMESFYVADERGGWIQLAKDPEIDFRGRFSEKAVNYGWVKKQHMLLWQHCLVACQSGRLNKKAMILNTVASLQEKSPQQLAGELASNALHFADAPETKNPAFLSSRVSGLFQVYFIYKEEGDALLLGKNARVSDPAQVQANVWGWVPKERVVLWDQRVALEPNWAEAAAAERQQSGKGLIFTDESSAAAYQGGQAPPPKTVLWDSDPLAERNVGEWRRFPVLNNNYQNGIARIGLMGDINAEHGVMTSEVFAKVQDGLSQAKSELRNIDIVFVVDATSSMGPYLPPVSEAITKSMSRIEAREDKNTYRFGAVAYRDTDEGKRKLEVKSLNSDGKAVSRFLEGVEAKDLVDIDAPEAMYYGLKNALFSTGMSKAHTNIIILVGDAGNHSRQDLTFVDLRELIIQLSDYNSHMLVFQARHSDSHPTYDDFIRQNKHLIQNIAFKANEKIEAATQLKVDFPIFKEEGQTLRIQGAMAGAIRSCPKNSKLDPAYLSREIEKIIDMTGQHLNKILGGAEQMFNDGASMESVVKNLEQGELNREAPSENQYVSSFTPAILLYLANSGLGPEEINMVTSQSFQMFIPAYAPLKREGQQYPLFNPVLFLSRRELSDLISQIDQFLDAPTNEARRKKMQEAWVELLRAHVGNLATSELEEMTMEEISERVFGLPSTSELIKDVRLRDLADKRKFPDETFNRYDQEMRAKKSKLERIFNQNNYPYSFQSNDISYYWIEQDLLP
jgi:hypothetical protein